MTLRLKVLEENGITQVMMRLPGVTETVPSGAPEPFASPLGTAHFEDLRNYLENYANLPPYELAAWGEAVERERLAACGEALYKAIFAGHPRRCDAYLRTKLAIENRRQTGVVFSSSDPRFLALPWELMKAPEARDPLSVLVNTFDRTLPGDEQAREFASIAQGFRVLMVTPRPADTGDAAPSAAPPLLRHLEAAKSPVRIDILRPPSFEAFRTRLKEAKEAGTPYHAVYFDGYGEATQRDGAPIFLSKNGVETLQSHAIFEHGDGEPEPVSVRPVATALARSDVPLIILRACLTRKAQKQGGIICPGAVMAVQLLEKDAASVVVMRHSLYPVAAAAFTAALFAELLAGRSVSEAVNIGRKALREESNRLRPGLRGGIPVQDWFTPVHFTRTFLRLRQDEVTPGPAFPAEETVAAVLDAAASADIRQAGGLTAAGDVFFGRDAEFFLLERAIRTRHIAIIHGVGGTGKTELAKGFARWQQISGGLDDPRLVFFHSFEPGRQAFGLDLIANEIMAHFGDAEACLAAKTTRERAELALRRLRQHRCLLIWDNFSTVASLPDPSRKMLPLDETGQADLLWFLGELRESKSALLITSRSREEWLGGPEIAGRCEAGGLSERDVLLYADWLLAPYPQASARRAADPWAFKALLDHLGGNPLSLKLILPQLSKSSACMLLESLKSEEMLQAGSGAEEGHLESLGASLHYSFRHLTDKDQRRLVILSLFEKVVPAQILGAMKDAPAQFQDPGQHGWNELLGRLADTGLLTNLGGGLYQLHPALPPYLNALWKSQTPDPADASAEREAALRSLIGAAGSIACHLNRQLRTEETSTALDQICALRTDFCAFLAAALERGLFPEAQMLILVLFHYWDSAALLQEAQAWSERVIAAIEPKPHQAPEAGTPAHELWLTAMARVGDHALQAGSFGKAEAYYRRIAGSIERHDSTRPDPNLAGAYYKLSMVEQERGVLEEAEVSAAKALAIFEALAAPMDIALCYHRLGTVARLRGHPGEAEGWYRKSLAIHDTLVDQPQMATAYQQLAQEAQQCGRHQEADGWYRKSLAIEEALRSVADSYYQLGFMAQDRGHPGEAGGWYKKSLSINEMLGNQPGLALNYHHLGSLAQALGRSREAEDWHRKSAAVEAELGNQPGVARSTRLLGTVLHKLGRFEEAGACYRKSLAIEEMLGSQAGMAADFHQLALLARDSGSSSEAGVWAMKAFAMFDMLGDELDKAKALALMAGLKAASADDGDMPCEPLPAGSDETLAQPGESGKAAPDSSGHGGAH
jgi:tetratricopeptide (TPR) repeat protein